MTRNLREVIAAVPAERRAKIAAAHREKLLLFRNKLIAKKRKRQLEEAKRVMEPAGPLYNRLDKVLAAATGV
jgi:hypothetical protein